MQIEEKKTFEERQSLWNSSGGLLDWNWQMATWLKLQQQVNGSEIFGENFALQDDYKIPVDKQKPCWVWN